MKIEAKKHGKGFKGWLAHKLVKLAQWVYPESPAVSAFYLSLMHDYIIHGQYITKMDLDKIHKDATNKE